MKVKERYLECPIADCDWFINFQVAPAPPWDLENAALSEYHDHWADAHAPQAPKPVEHDEVTE